MRPLSGIHLPADQVHSAHIAVLLEAHHVAGTVIRAVVHILVLHEMPDRNDIMFPAPFRHAAVHDSAPCFGKSLQVLVSGGGIVITCQLELIRHVSFLPVDLPFLQNHIQFRTPVAFRLRLIVEEAGYGLTKVVFEMIMVRLIHLLDEPLGTVAACTIYR